MFHVESRALLSTGWTSAHSPAIPWHMQNPCLRWTHHALQLLEVAKAAQDAARARIAMVLRWHYADLDPVELQSAKTPPQSQNMRELRQYLSKHVGIIVDARMILENTGVVAALCRVALPRPNLPLPARPESMMERRRCTATRHSSEPMPTRLYVKYPG